MKVASCRMQKAERMSEAACWRARVAWVSVRRGRGLGEGDAELDVDVDIGAARSVQGVGAALDIALDDWIHGLGEEGQVRYRCKVA